MVDDAIGVLFNRLSMLILFSDPNLPNTEWEIISYTYMNPIWLINTRTHPSSHPSQDAVPK